MEWMETTGVRFISGALGSGKRSKFMQTDNRFLDDLAKVASGALGSVSGVKHEVEVRIQQQLDKLLAVLGKPHITVETVTLNGSTYRITNDRSDKSKSIIVRVS